MTARTGGRDRRLPTMLGLFAVLVAMNNIGSVAMPTLVEDQPALLLALSSRTRHLILTVPSINPIAFAIVPMLRLGAAAALTFAFGWYYGDRGSDWVERTLEGQRPATLRWIETGMDKAGSVVVLLMPGSNIVCALAGYRRMNPIRFAVLAAIGLGGRLAIIWFAAQPFESELESVQSWISKYQWRLTIALLVLVVAQSFLQASRQAKADERAAAEAEAAERQAAIDDAAEERAALDAGHDPWPPPER